MWFMMHGMWILGEVNILSKFQVPTESLLFGSKGVKNIFRKRNTELVSYLIIDNTVCWTAFARQGLLNIFKKYIYILI